MISKYASDVSAIPEVRAFLMELQRSLAREHSVIMDGRDIGTVVLPDAEVKVFLCADVETRARRRFLELEQRGTPKPFDEVLRDMEQRDYNDTHRAAAPLRPADDAIMIDNTDMGLRGQPGAAAGCDTGACGIVRNKFYAAAWRVLRPAGAVFSAGGPAGNGASGGRRTGAAVRQSLQRLGPHPIRAVHAPAVQRADHG